VTSCLSPGERPDDRQDERHHVRPALIVREDHLDEEDADREADDRADEHPESGHSTS